MAAAVADEIPATPALSSMANNPPEAAVASHDAAIDPAATPALKERNNKNICYNLLTIWCVCIDAGGCWRVCVCVCLCLIVGWRDGEKSIVHQSIARYLGFINSR